MIVYTPPLPRNCWEPAQKLAFRKDEKEPANLSTDEKPEGLLEFDYADAERIYTWRKHPDGWKASIALAFR